MTMMHFPTINAPGELYASNFKEQVQTLYGTLKINSIPESYSKLQIPHTTASEDIYFPLSNTSLSIMDSSVLANAIMMNDYGYRISNHKITLGPHIMRHN